MDLAELAQLRCEYRSSGLSESDLDPDPLVQFGRWYAAWQAVAVGEPNAVVVATATPDGRPSLRTVLLKGVSPAGFTFFTNYDSRKGRELAANPRAALLFPWHAIGRQLTVEGVVERLPEEESDAYWATRPLGSRLGALASPQSAVVADRGELDRRFAAAAAAHEGAEVPRPPNWGGYRVEPDRVELWQGRENRVHDRLEYLRDRATPSGWRIQRLAP